MTGPPIFETFEEKMRRARASRAAIETFRRYWERVRNGETGLIPSSAIRPVLELPDAEILGRRAAETGRKALDRLVVIKLNGGLGTSMGLEKAKSLLPVRDGLTFLDLIVRHVLRSRERTGARLPLLLMNSFRTEADTLRHLERYPSLPVDGLPLGFLQHRVPRIDAATLEPLSWPERPELEWCPPGHGDLYLALAESGLLDRLLELGYRWAFVSNADNLGAAVSETILGHMVLAGHDFLMEAADRTPADRKGGHLAMLPGGRLVLRESAQCPPEELETFQNVDRYRYFNTNNLWIDLEALRKLIDTSGGLLILPTIINHKTADPRDPSTPPVIQLETAMGTAISVFERSGAVRVARNRFSPVKTTDDLLAVRSDAYVLTDDARVVLAPSRDEPPSITLDPEHYRLVDRFDVRFPEGPPSLILCRSLTVHGNVTFGPGVIVRGDVIVEASRTATLRAGAVLEGTVRIP